MSHQRRRGRLKPILIVALVAVAVAVVIWARIRPDATQPAIPESSGHDGVVGLIVEPDDGRQPVLAEIDAARTTVDLAVYLLTDDAVIDALIDAHERGVTVRVMLDQYPYGGFGNPEETAASLRSVGIEVRWGLSRFTFSHVKTMVVDRSVALIMNLNLTRSSFEKNREFAVVTTRPDDVKTAQAIFDADWNDSDDVATDPLVVSPSNSRSALTALIESATTTIEIYAEVIRDVEIVELLRAKAAQGVEVRVVTSPDADPVALRILNELVESGAEVHLVSSPYIHAKAIVVDDRVAYIGSQNFTATSLDENREIGVILEDRIVVERVSATFATDFASGTPVDDG